MMTQEEVILNRIIILEKEMNALKQELFEVRKSQELRGNTFEYQMASLRERISSVMEEMKERNFELVDKFDKHLIYEEKNQNTLNSTLEKFNSKIQFMSDGITSTREKQTYFKDEIEKLSDLTSNNRSALENKLDLDSSVTNAKVEKLEKSYYIATGAMLVILSLIEVGIKFIT